MLAPEVEAFILVPGPSPKSAADSHHPSEPIRSIGPAPAVAATTDPFIGHRLDGRYTLEELIGEGGTGRVYRARQEATGREVAVKLLRESLIHDDASVKRFQREARAACRINHPNAITVHDFGFSPTGQCYLVTELISGETLRVALDRDGKDGPIPPQRALRLFQEIVAGMAAAHDKGVVHRKLHPGNIFLCRGPAPGSESSGGDEHVKVFDFGGARLLDSSLDTDVTGVGQLDLKQLLHSIRYLPPERLQRNFRPDPRGDVYSLGLILFELCTGVYPYDAEDPLQVMAMHLNEPPPLLSTWAPDRWFSPILQGLVTSMLAKDPALRPADAAEVAERLSDAQDREVLITVRVSVPEPDVEVEMVALPADEEELGTLPGPDGPVQDQDTGPVRSQGVAMGQGPAQGQRAARPPHFAILVSIAEGDEERIASLPTLLEYSETEPAAGRQAMQDQKDDGPRGRLPFHTLVDDTPREGARVTVMKPEPLSLTDLRRPAELITPPGTYRRLIVAVLCVGLGAGVVFATGTLAYRWERRRTTHGMTTPEFPRGAEPAPAPLAH